MMPYDVIDMERKETRFLFRDICKVLPMSLNLFSQLRTFFEFASIKITSFSRV